MSRPILNDLAMVTDVVRRVAPDLSAEHLETIETLAKAARSPAGIALDLGVIGDAVAKRDKAEAARIYRVAWHLFSVQPAHDPFERLMAALAAEKGGLLPAALTAYEGLRATKGLSRDWDILVNACHSRTLGKRAMEKKCGWFASLWLRDSARLFLEAAGMQPGRREKWIAAADEMNRMAGDACAELREMAAARILPALGGGNRRTLEIGGGMEFAFYEGGDPRGPRYAVSAGVHGNEIGGVYALTEWLCMSAGDPGIVAVPCVDPIGFLCRGIDAAIPVKCKLPEYVTSIRETSHGGILAVETSAPPPSDWLARLLRQEDLHNAMADAKHLVWIMREAEEVRGRSFVITDDGLFSPGTERWFKGMPGSPCQPWSGDSIHLWLDLHESLGNGVHVYIDGDAEDAFADIAAGIVAATRLPPVESIWNRTRLGHGVYLLPKSARLGCDAKRIVVEVGESLPLDERISAFVAAITRGAELNVGMR